MTGHLSSIHKEKVVQHMNKLLPVAVSVKNCKNKKYVETGHLLTIVAPIGKPSASPAESSIE